MTYLKLMIYTFATLFFTVYFAASAHAADRYWVGGTGNWSDATNHWSDITGGTPGAGFLPTPADNAHFNSASNATGYTVTFDVSAYCFDLDIANPASGVITLAGSSELNVNGDFELAPGMTNNYTGGITFSAGTGKNVSAQDSTPSGVTFNSDGTKMYVVGYDTHTVYQYALSTAWDVSTSIYTSLSKNVGAQEVYPYSVTFSPDGTKMYILGYINRAVYQYSLSIAWDVSTASYASITSTRLFSDESPSGVTFSSDGTKMYVVGMTNDTVYQYTLSTAWDVSTSTTYTSILKSVSAQDTTPRNVAMSADGMKMYVMGDANDTVYQYSLGTAWDISTATYVSLSKGVAAQDTASRDVFFNPDGTKMYVLGSGADSVNQYSLSAAWDVSPASFGPLTTHTITSSGVTLGSTLLFSAVGGSWQLQDALSTTEAVTLNTGTLDTNDQSVSSLTFATTGTETLDFGTSTWTVTGNNATIWQTGGLDMEAGRGTVVASYNGSTGTRTISMGLNVENPNLLVTGGSDAVTIFAGYVWDLDFTGFSGTWSASSGALSIYGNLTLASGMTNLNTATITMASTSSRSVSAQSLNPYGVAFNSDGKKMYVLASGGTVYQYTLGTAWDVSTASYSLISKSFRSEETDPRGFYFGPDGTKMYIVGIASDSVYQYTLSTAWDVSTAAYASLSKNVAAQDSSPYGLTFNSDGTKMHLLGGSSDTVYQYALGTAWDISTATYISLSKQVTTEDYGPTGLAFSPDGTKMYIGGEAHSSLYQYALSTAWDVSTASYSSLSKDISGQEWSPGIAFNPDGSKMYVIGRGSKKVSQYSLSTTWDISTASFGFFTPREIRSNGSSLAGNFVFNGLGGGWRLQDDLLLTGTGLTLTNGTFDPNGHGVSMTGTGTAAVSGAFTFYDFTRMGTAVATDVLAFSSDIVVTNLLTLIGNSSVNKITVKSNMAGTQRHISAGSVSLSNARFMEIDADGAAIPWTGTKIYDLGGNNDITFSSIVSLYWVGGTGNWSDAANHWATSPGGSPDAGNIPTAEDNVIFHSSSGAASYIVTVDATADCRDFIVAQPASGVVTLGGNAPLSISGSVELVSGMINNYAGDIVFSAQYSRETVMSNGVPFGGALIFDGPGGGWQLQDALFTTGSVTLANGTLDTDGHSVSSSTFTTAAGTKALDFGTSTWTVTGNNATVWNWSSSGAKMVCSGCTIVSNYSGSSGTRTFRMEGDYYNMNAVPNLSVIAGADTLVITSYSDFRNIDFTGFSGTWSASTNVVNIYGNLTLSPGMTSNSAAVVTMKATPSVRVTGSHNEGMTFSPDGTKMYVVGTTDDTVYQYALSTAWDVSSASYSLLSKNVAAQDGDARGIAFSSDGTKMYVAGMATNSLYQYTLSTAWDVSTASYAVSFAVFGVYPAGIVFSSDGTKMYLPKSGSIRQYVLSTAWDISTASYVTAKSLNDPESEVTETVFSPDGMKMYTIVDGDIDAVYQYALSNAWDVSTATLVSFPISVLQSAAYKYPSALTISPDGTRLYVLNSFNGTVFQYVLPIAWDVSTARFSLTSPKTITSNGKSIGGSLTFDGDGGKWQLQDALSVSGVVTLQNGTLETNDQSVVSQRFTTAAGTKTLDLGDSTWMVTGNGTTVWIWDPTTATLPVNTATVVASYAGGTGFRSVEMGNGVVTSPSLAVTAGSDSFYTNTSGARFFRSIDFTGFSGTWISSQQLNLRGDMTLSSAMINNATARITFMPFEWKTYISNSGSNVGFSSDGKKMYVLVGSAVKQYSLGIAWDVSTVSPVSFSKVVAGNEGLAFSSNGKNMYVTDRSSKNIYQYTLNIAWDLSTASASYVTSKNVSAQDANPYGLSFNSDGTKMYVMGDASDTVYQYALSNAWDVSTASYVSLSKNVSAQDATPRDIKFNSDGTKMYVMGDASDTVYQYALSNAWDVSTASYTSISKNVSVQDAIPRGFIFSSDGTRMYVMGDTNDTVYQYSLSTAWDISTANYIYLSDPINTITSNGNAFVSDVIIDGIGSSWQLQDNFTILGSRWLMLGSGTFNGNGKEVSVSSFSVGGTNTTLIKGSGTWTLTGTGSVWNIGLPTHFTDAGTTKLTNNSASDKTFAGGGKTYNNFWNATGGTGTVTIMDSNTFSDFKSDAGRTTLFTAGTTQSVNSVTSLGTLGNEAVFGSTTTSPFSLTKVGLGLVTVPYCSVSYSTVSPANAWYTGTGFIDGGNNSGWMSGSAPVERELIHGTIKTKGGVRLK
jgi:DNA-binding beta-propeller fold protein YncE